MYPSGTPEKPKIAIEGIDVASLKLGMATSSVIYSVNQEITTAIREAEDTQGSPEFWREPVEVDASEENIAMLGVALYGVVSKRFAWEGNKPHYRSELVAQRRVAQQNVKKAQKVLVELAGGEENLDRLKDHYDKKWRNVASLHNTS